MHGEEADWTLDTHLLALIADIGAVANWQRTKDGHTGKNPPKGLPRPGDAKAVARPTQGHSMEEARRLLDAATGPGPKKPRAATRRTPKKRG